MSSFKVILLSGSVLILGPTASIAQQPPTPPAPPTQTLATPLYDPQQLPAYKGQVQLFTLTPRGDIDGFVLSDGMEVKTPPHLSTEIAYSVKPGDAITIHGLKAASLPLIQATSVTVDASGKTIVDNGPDGAIQTPPPPPPITGPAQNGPAADQAQTQGRVRMALHGPRGEVNGALLEDGTILRLPPHMAASLSAALQPGQTIFFSGTDRVTALGKVLDVTGIGTAPNQLMPVGPDGPRGPGRLGPPPV
jgi:hypothetical protein